MLLSMHPSTLLLFFATTAAHCLLLLSLMRIGPPQSLSRAALQSYISQPVLHSQARNRYHLSYILGSLVVIQTLKTVILDGVSLYHPEIHKCVCTGVPQRRSFIFLLERDLHIANSHSRKILGSLSHEREEKPRNSFMCISSAECGADDLKYKTNFHILDLIII